MHLRCRDRLDCACCGENRASQLDNWRQTVSAQVNAKALAEKRRKARAEKRRVVDGPGRGWHGPRPLLKEITPELRSTLTRLAQDGEGDTALRRAASDAGFEITRERVRTFRLRVLGKDHRGAQLTPEGAARAHPVQGDSSATHSQNAA